MKRAERATGWSRKIRSWGHACEIVAPSLIPQRPGERRKHDKKDAEELARLYRAGELVTIRVPTEREERVRDLVRCRGTFQREILKSRHYILKFLTRRGLVYREGKNWTGKHWAWLRAIQRDGVLETEDQVAFGEYLALLDYKLDRREELDRQIEALALEPSYKEAVGRLCCLKGISTQAADGAGHRDRGFPAFRTSGQADGLRRAGAERALERRARGGKARSRRRATAGPGMCWCRRRGPTASRLGVQRQSR